MNGQDICFNSNGIAVTSERPSLVLIHGSGGSKLDWPQSWRSVAAATAPLGLPSSTAVLPGQGGQSLHSYPVFAIDLPGHGGSYGQSLSDIDSYGSAVFRFIEALGLENVCLVGHSMGAGVVLSAALQSSERISSLCLIAGAARMSVTPDLLEGLKNQTENTVAAIARSCWHKSTPEHFVKTTRQRMMSAGGNVLLDDFTACSKLDLRAKLSALQVPTLILAAQEDRMVKATEIEAMAQAIPMAQLQIFHACGHFLHVEIASEIAKKLVAFLGAQI
ncbi:putative alpha / beta fold hydrolase (plasmid) [Phaeobacter inhibens]|uniref:Alpha/beta hydrolase n=2 Tax=Rhodobacterales TaxID=204455 RepID=A0ABZ0HNT9_TRISK|nr:MULTISPECIES: alpha/beta hydrolase [Rhodobacterales]AUQ97031.1 putative alpha / beta fold hydrolase [Phaeobacter inhibens]MCF6430343.1 alpha/beta hydrolase [Leisingera sp. MMG026]WOI35536.1 alpha/beta hydrolase [Tritonibacter scottomollicae]